MKRITKNIISFIIMLIIIGGIGLTIYFAKSNLSSTTEVLTENTVMSTMTNEMTTGTSEMKEMPTGDNDDANMTTPPEKPDGESGNEEVPTKPDGEGSNEEVPAKPDGEGSNEEVPEMPDGENNMQAMPDMSNMGMNFKEEVKLDTMYIIILGVESLLLALVIVYLIQSRLNKKTIKETYYNGDKILIGVLFTIILTALFTFGITYLTNNYVLNSESNVSSNNSNIAYDGKTVINEDSKIEDEEYSSSNSDENAILVSGNVEVTLKKVTVSKTGDSDGGDNTSFYGTNSAIIAKDGAELTIKKSTITTDATGANGVFSYGGSATTNNSSSDGTTINISDSTITTSKDNSGGIMTTGGGIMNASNLTVTTAGTSSAAIRSDRGGGTVNVDGGTYKTTGQGSPSIYSTANITVKNATLESTSSEGIIIEGKNSVSIENVTLTDTNNKLNGQSTTYKNIFLYQSMSGDASDGTSEFTAKDSTITTNKGDTFYITNTTSKITLTNNTITNNDSSGNFLRAMADSWGNTGSNGGVVTLVMNNQKVTGNIVIDSVSTLDMTLTASTYTGTINGSNEAKSITLTLDKNSKIKLTGNSYITSLTNKDTSNSNIDFNGYKLYVNGKSIN